LCCCFVVGPSCVNGCVWFSWATGRFASNARRCCREGLADLAWLPGERRDIPDVMRSLDCFVLPSIVEGISNTILEAMASGLAVVATRVGGNADLIDDGSTGRLVPPNDPAAIADALDELSADPLRASRLATQARVAVERQFDLQSMVAAYAKVYDQLLSRHQSA
jgi:glycosyltransferase involved in cell wall biosynthesis